MHKKRFKEGRGVSNPQDRAALLPQPIPGGDKIIDQIADVIWHLNGCKSVDKPVGDNYIKGDTAAHKNPLYEHLKFTFLYGTKNERGLFLVQYIESMRTDSGVEEIITSQQTMNISYKDLNKQ